MPVAGSRASANVCREPAIEHTAGLWAKRGVPSAGIVLVVCTLWGFGETYANAPVLKAWLVFPLFWAVSAIVWPFVRPSR